MNYANFSMDELVNILENEPDRDRFIAASKQFVQNWVNGDFSSPDELRDAQEEAREEGIEFARTACQKEAVEIMDGGKGYFGQCDVDEWEAMTNSMKMLG